MNRIQNKIFNKLMSDAKAFLSGSEGNDVAVFTAEGNLESALIDNGFAQSIEKDKFGYYYGHSIWWNSEIELLVSNVPNTNRFTVATEKDPLFASDI